MTEAEAPRMPEVDFKKDKVHQYLIDQAKVAEKDNIRRAVDFKHRIRWGRISMTTLATTAISIYGYTMFAVKSETFLNNFDEPTLDDD